MSKRSDESSKDAEMSIDQQMPALMFEAVPPRLHDNRKSWLTRFAQTVGWGQRRTKALFYCEARVVTAEEWKTINERLNAAKQRERLKAESTHERRVLGRGMGSDLPLDTREDLLGPVAAPSGEAVSRKVRET